MPSPEKYSFYQFSGRTASLTRRAYRGNTTPDWVFFIEAPHHQSYRILEK